MKRYYFRQGGVDLEIDEEDYNNHKQHPKTYCKVMALENDELCCGVNRNGENCLNALAFFNGTGIEKVNIGEELLHQYADARARKVINAYRLFLQDNTRLFLRSVLGDQYNLKNYRIFDGIRYDYYINKMDTVSMEGKYWDVDTNTMFLYLQLCDAAAASYIRMRRLHTTMSYQDFMRITGGKMFVDIVNAKIKEAGTEPKILED